MRKPILLQRVYPHRELTFPVEHALFRQSSWAAIHIISVGQHPHA